MINRAILFKLKKEKKENDKKVLEETKVDFVAPENPTNENNDNNKVLDDQSVDKNTLVEKLEVFKDNALLESSSGESEEQKLDKQVSKKKRK